MTSEPMLHGGSDEFEERPVRLQRVEEEGNVRYGLGDGDIGRAVFVERYYWRD